jgi:hypothetical protein
MRNLAAVILLGIGVMQMAGEIFHLPVLSGIGAAIVAAPAPKVFSAVRGFETYSTRFFLEWQAQQAQDKRTDVVHSLELTPAISTRLAGPYNRRNVYGAALAYGPVLAMNPDMRPMLEAVMDYAFCGKAPLLQELGIDPDDVAGYARVRVEPRPGANMHDLPQMLEPSCP